MKKNQFLFLSIIFLGTYSFGAALPQVKYPGLKLSYLIGEETTSLVKKAQDALAAGDKEKAISIAETLKKSATDGLERFKKVMDSIEAKLAEDGKTMSEKEKRHPALVKETIEDLIVQADKIIKEAAIA